jgi:ribosome-associated protein
MSGRTGFGTGACGVANPMNEPAPRTIMLDQRPINLTQVLKLAGCAQSGGEAKVLVAEGQVCVNGEVELRKRRQMKAGDTVVLKGGPTIALIGAAQST